MGTLGSPGDKKVSVKRMTETVFDGPGRRNQRLTQHLTAENPLRTVFRAHPAENVHLDCVEIEQRDQLRDGRVRLVVFSCHIPQ